MGPEQTAQACTDILDELERAVVGRAGPWSSS